MKSSRTDSPVDKLRAALREMASEQPLRSQSIFQKIKEILPEIRDLKNKRFTDVEILQRLSANGIGMSLGTFRQYVNRAMREQSGTPTKTKRQRKIEPVVRAEPSVTPTPPAQASPAPDNANKESKVVLTHNPNRKL